MDAPAELASLLSCSLCRRRYDSLRLVPMMLHCQHSYCACCVDALGNGGAAILCPQCGRCTHLPAGGLSEHRGLMFLMKQLPALRVGMAMLEQTTKQSEEAAEEDEEARLEHSINWPNMESVFSMAMSPGSSDCCLLHVMPTTMWCQDCRRMLCRVCAADEEHHLHQLARPFEAADSLRQLLTQSLAEIERISTQTSELAAREISLLRQLSEACSTVQLHIRRGLLENAASMQSCQMRGWWQRADRDVQRYAGHMSTSELLLLLTRVKAQRQQFRKQFLDFYRKSRLRASIYEGGMELLDCGQLNRRLQRLHERHALEPMPATVEPPPALLLTNYCVYEYWNALGLKLQRQLAPNSCAQQAVGVGRPPLELLPHGQRAVVPPHYNQRLRDQEVERQLRLDQQQQEQELQWHSRSYNNNNNNYNNNGMELAPIGTPSGSSSSSSMSITSRGGGAGGGAGQMMQRNSTTQLFDNSDYNRLSLELLRATATRTEEQPLLNQRHEAEQQPQATNWSQLEPYWAHSMQQQMSLSRQPDWEQGQQLREASSNSQISQLPRRPVAPCYPLYFLDIKQDGQPAGRVLIEVRNDVAPRMAANFRALILHEQGFGYKGCAVFQAWGNESIITGDFESQNGRGGHAAFEDRYFMPEDTGLRAERGTVGMRRGQKRHDNCGFVGSQFRLVLNEMRSFTAIFARIVHGIEVVDKIAATGDSTGRPGSRSIISNCGDYRAQ